MDCDSSLIPQYLAFMLRGLELTCVGIIWLLFEATGWGRFILVTDDNYTTHFAIGIFWAIYPLQHLDILTNPMRWLTA